MPQAEMNLSTGAATVESAPTTLDQLHQEALHFRAVCEAATTVAATVDYSRAVVDLARESARRIVAMAEGLIAATVQR